MSEDDSVIAPLRQTRKRTLSSKSVNERSSESNLKKKNVKEKKKEHKGFCYCLFLFNIFGIILLIKINKVLIKINKVLAFLQTKDTPLLILGHLVN